MLRERDFYEVLDSDYEPPLLTLREKVDILLKTLQEGDERLQKNREKVQKELMGLAEQFDIEMPINQQSLNIG